MNTVSSRSLKSEILEDFLNQVNDTEAPYSHNKTVHQLFEAQVLKNPHQIALYSPAGDITFQTLNEKANQVAWTLREIGVKANTIVGIDIERSLNLLIVILGILKAGGAYLPIEPNLPFLRKKQLIEDSQLKQLIIDAHSSELENLHDLEIIQFDKMSCSKKHNPSPNSTPEDLAYVIYTSGSTGKPKGVCIQHRALVNRLEWMQKTFPLGSKDVILQKTCYGFDVSVWELLWWAIAGASISLLAPNQEHNVFLFTKIIQQHKVTVMHFVPTVLDIFLDYIDTGYNLEGLKSLKYVFSSGSALQPLAVQRFNSIFKERYPILVNLYGPTEATIDVSYFICKKNIHYDEIPIGKPIQNIQLYVLDKELRPVSKDIPGELYISGVGLGSGYLNDPILTEKSFTTSPYMSQKRLYKTGDLAKWNELGELIYLGRVDDQIKIRGIRISLLEIQQQIKTFPEIKDVFVFTNHQGTPAMYIVAAIIPLKNALPFNLEGLKAFLKQRLPSYMIPTHFKLVNDFILKKNGKIDVNALQKLF